MALVQISSEQAWNDANGVSFNMGSNFTANNTAFILLTYWYPSGAAAPTATVEGNAATVDRSHNYATNTEYLAIIRKLCVGGSAAVAITAPAGSYGNSICLEWSDVDTSSPLDQNPTPTTGTTGDPSITSGTLSQASELVLSLVVNDGDTTPPAGWEAPSGWTLAYNYPNWNESHSGGAAYEDVNSTDAVTAAWNWTIAQNLNWAAIMCTYKLSGGGGGGSVATPDHHSVLSFPSLSRKPRRDDGRWTRGRSDRIWRKAA